MADQQLYFQGPYRPQKWPFKYSLINYITMNPSNSKAWQKLIQTCKFFFAKNPVLVIEKLSSIFGREWRASLNGFEKDVNFASIHSKFWVTDQFFSFYFSVSSVISYLYQVHAKTLKISKQTILYNDYLFISSKVEDIDLYQVTVKKEDGTIVPLEELVEVLPKIKEIKLLKYKHTQFYLNFGGVVSAAYKTRLEEIIDEILQTKNHDYKVPLIIFYGLDQEKCKKLHSLFDKN
uniref:Uncharacterized protein n=1 Tax=Panagrolaimus davidi TaxID=227884 RepID=A0A914PWR4_9BILA